MFGNLVPDDLPPGDRLADLLATLFWLAAGVAITYHVWVNS